MPETAIVLHPNAHSKARVLRKLVDRNRGQQFTFPREPFYLERKISELLFGDYNYHLDDGSRIDSLFRAYGRFDQRTVDLIYFQLFEVSGWPDCLRNILHRFGLEYAARALLVSRHIKLENQEDWLIVRREKDAMLQLRNRVWYLVRDAFNQQRQPDQPVYLLPEPVETEDAWVAEVNNLARQVDELVEQSQEYGVDPAAYGGAIGQVVDRYAQVASGGVFQTLHDVPHRPGQFLRAVPADQSGPPG